MSHSKLALTFRMFQNGHLVREDTLTQSVIKIGKVPSAHLQIADEAVSRMHAIVEVTGHEVSLIDLGSTRGTFVNGKKINKARLEAGDVIMLGDTRLELGIAEDGAAAQRAPTRPPALPAAARRITATDAVTISGVIESTPAAPPSAPVTVAARLVAVSTATTFAPSEPAAASPIAPAVTTPRPSSSNAPASTPSAVAAVVAPHPVVAFEPSRSASAAVAPHVTAAVVPPSAPTAAAPLLVVTAAPPASTPAAVGPRMAATPGLSPSARGVPLERLSVFSQAVAESADELGGARAVEVAAMLGDSVVGVKHCVDPRSGKVAPATWGVVAGGLVCLAASAIAFTASVHIAGENRARFETWTRVQNKPAYAFRPHVLPPGVDWIAFGGFGLALVGLSLGVVRMRRERISPYYRIGTAPGVELALDGAPAPAFPLIAPSPSGDDFVFNYGAGIDGELLLDGKSLPLSELAAAGRARPSASTAGAIEVPIPPRARIRARAGRTTFLISSVARPRRHAVPLLAGLESRAMTYFAGSLAVHLGVWAILQLVPPDASAASIDLPIEERILVGIKMPGTIDPMPEPDKDPGVTAGGQGSAPMPLPSGASGNPETSNRGRILIERTAPTPQLSSREVEIERARTAGFLGALAASPIRVLGAELDLASGFDSESFNGPLYGAYGEGGGGNFGGGRSGFGIGGGCSDDCGTIGTSTGYRIGGLARVPGYDYGLHSRGYGPRDRRPDPPQAGEPTLRGAGYDKSIIRRYIRRHIDKIGYCYDKQLLAHPELAGEITATFLIGPGGEVQTASGTGFDRDVASCVAGVIKTISFPRPGDGIGVQVNYPFHFHPAGRGQ